MSAKRFGGAHSPGGDPTGAETSRRTRMTGGKAKPSGGPNVRSWIMFILPTPLLFAVLDAMLNSAPIRLILCLVAYAAFMLGAWLLREGQKAEAEFNARAIAKPPAFPRKICSAILAGIGVLLASWIGSSGGGLMAFGVAALTAIIYAVLAVGLHLMAFGLDPMKAKGMEDRGIAAAEMERVSDALDKAENKLQSIESLARSLNDREISEKVTDLNATVREMIKLVEEDPRDLGRARRYLGVYLKGADDATRKYTNNHERLNDPALRAEYLALLTDLQDSFARGKETLLLDDRTDLEVEIEVLRDRLGQEGA